MNPSTARSGQRGALRRRPSTRLAAGVASALLLLLAMLPGASLATTDSAMTPACDSVNLRTGTSTGSAVKVTLRLGAAVTVAAQVAGGPWSTACPTAKSGSGWYRVSAIGGRSVSSLYGVSALYAATGVLKAAAAPAPTPTPTPAPAAGTDPLGAELTRLINLDRQALGKAPYQIDTRLAEIARDAPFSCPTNPSLALEGRAQDMANRDYFSHTVPGCYLAGTTTPYGSLEIVRTVFGYTQAQSEILHWNAYANASQPTSYQLGCDINGQNCAGGTTTAPFTVTLAQRSFMSSSPHRTSELNSYQRMGCGSATVPGTTKTYYACLFANGGPTAPAPSPTPPPAGTSMAPACAGVNLRTGSSTGSAVKVSLGTSARVTVVGTVTGGSWSTTCPTAKSGSGWYRVSEVNGRSVSSLYGVSTLYAATGVLTAVAAPTPSPTPAPTPSPTPSPTPAPTPSPTPSPTPAPTPSPTPAPTPSPTPAPTPAQPLMAPACDQTNLRASASTSGAVKATLRLGATVTVAGTVSGGSWSTSCPVAKSGSTWYRVTAVNGRSVSDLYGASTVYAATGVLKTVPAPTALPASVTFYGRGWGHGVGLSQYGARGRALAGQDAATIVAHYYQGTTIGSLAADPPVRVLVLDDFAASATAPVTIFGRGGAWTITGVAGTLPADARARVIPTTSGASTTWRLVVDQGATVLADVAAPSDLTAAGADPATTLQLDSKPSAYDLYRGALRILLHGALADVVNTVPMESYLRGVVPAEMPSGWPAEALKAQALAARSYTAYRLHPTTGAFDLYDDTRSQVYLGVRAEKATTDAAIAATARQVIKAGSAIANAMFHSAGGGATENNEYAFVSASGAVTSAPVSYLRGSSDRDAQGVAYDAASPYATWRTATYSLSALSAIFAADSRTAVGALSGLGLSFRGVSGRLVAVTLYGSAGTRTVSGDVFVAAFNGGRPSGDPAMMSSLVGLAPIP